MIYSLNGKVLRKTPDEMVISCAGVGFHVYVPQSVYAAVPNEGEDALIYTYLNVKEDGVDLYGFADERQRECFKMLISVSGVGPKAALSILSLYSAERVASAIARGEHEAFCACSGIGPKIAQRITLELKNKVSASAAAGVPMTGGSEASDAVAALISLGFTAAEASAAVAKAPAGSSAEDMIRLALTHLSGRRG